MKKILSFILALCVAAAALPSVFAGAKTEAAAEEPLFRIGIMSDHQMNTATGENAEALISALNDFHNRGVDAIIEAGDIADSNPDTIYSFYKQKYSEIIGDDVPLISVPGNHDVWSDNTLNIYRQYFGEPNKHVVVGGYHFVVISANPSLGTATNGNYGAAEKNFARNELAAAAADTPEGQPIFVITHQHVSNTVYGSGPNANWANDFLWGIIDNYPNAVHFSGHSHFVLEDERSIWQGGFTAIGTSSMAYTELEYGKANGSVPPEASLAKQYLYLEIYSDRIEIERIKASTGRQIKDKWVLDLPLQKSTFKYTDARANDRTAPFFLPDAAVETASTTTDITVTFDAAKHEDFVHSYRLKLYKNNSSSPLKDILIFSDFYKGLENMQQTVSWTFADVAEEYAVYRFEAYPIESFGKVGEPLVYEFASVKQMSIPKFTRGKLFTVDFSTGEARNAESALEVKRTGGSVEKTDGKYAFIPGDDSKLTVSMTNSYYTLTQKKLTLDVVFSVNAFGSEQTLASCYSNGGLRLWLGADGKLCATVNKSDKTDLTFSSESAVPLRDAVNAVLTYNGNTAILRVNGETVATAALTGNINYNRNAKYGIGSDPNGDNRLNGAVFTASLNSSAMSDADIQALFNGLANGHDIRVLDPALEQLRRISMLREANPGNAVLNKILDYYEAEISSLTDSAYVTSAIIDGAIAYRDIDADVLNTNAVNLSAYTAPVINGIEHKAHYDEGEAPVPTFTDAAEITLDGEPYAAGDPIGNGEHTLIAYNGWRLDGVQFSVGAAAPVIYGVEDGKTYDLTTGDAPAITWEPADLPAQLDNRPYVAGTPVTADGWHTFMLPYGSSTLVYAFKIEHSAPVISGVEDGRVYNLLEEDAPAITWAPADLPAQLDNQPYVAGTPVTADGWHTFMLPYGSSMIVYAFKIEHKAPAIKGDLDNDGEISVNDALIALRMAVKLTETDLAADVDGDGEVSVNDALLILRAAVGLTTL